MDWHNEVLYIVHVILRVSVVCLCLHYPFTFYNVSLWRLYYKIFRR